MPKSYRKKRTICLPNQKAARSARILTVHCIRDPDFQEGSSSSSEDDSSEEDDYVEDVSNDNAGNDPTVISEFRDITGNNQQTFAFVGNEGLHPNLVITNSFTVLNAYSVFVTENLLEIMVIKTNRNAHQAIAKLGRPKSKSRLSVWKPVTVPEMRKILGIVLYMGLVRYLTIKA